MKWTTSAAAWEDYALVAGPFFQSAGSWQGGGSALAQAFATRLREAEVRVRCNAPVVGIAASTKGVSAVHIADGSVLPANLCFFTGHPAELPRLLPKGLLRPCFATRLTQAQESLFGILLFAEIAEPLFEDTCWYLLPHEERSFPLVGESDDPLAALFLGEPTARGGRSLLAILPIGAHHPIVHASLATYAREKERVTAACVRFLERRIPGLARAWRVLCVATPQTMIRWNYGNRYNEEQQKQVGY